MLAKHSQFKDAVYLRVVRQRERVDPFRGIGSAGISPVGSIGPAVSLSAKPSLSTYLDQQSATAFLSSARDRSAGERFSGIDRRTVMMVCPGVTRPKQTWTCLCCNRRCFEVFGTAVLRSLPFPG
jgi:hypothetical protein